MKLKPRLLFILMQDLVKGCLLIFSAFFLTMQYKIYPFFFCLVFVSFLIFLGKNDFEFYALF